jgi:L-fucose mutarotase
MLKGINPLLTPELLYALRAMGHGDEITVVDANFTVETLGPKPIRIAGADAPPVVEAILSLMPLDDFVEVPVHRMQVVGAPDKNLPVFDDFAKAVRKHGGKVKIGSLERFAFYERAKKSYAVVATSEPRLYGNLILKKGVIRPDER